MKSTQRIEQIRTRTKPTCAVPPVPVMVRSTAKDDHPGRVGVGLEWFAEQPLSIALVVYPQVASDGVNVWEMSRELVHFAFAEPGHEFGLGDVVVAVLKPTPTLISIRDFEDNTWRTFELSTSALAELMYQSIRRVSLPDDMDLAPKPYTRTVRP